MASVTANSVVTDVRRLVVLSERMVSNDAFARQARRKFASGSGAGSKATEGWSDGTATAATVENKYLQQVRQAQTARAQALAREGSDASATENGSNPSVIRTTSESAAVAFDAWLGNYELDDYAAGMKDQGYSSVRFLKAASEDDLVAICIKIDEFCITIDEFCIKHDDLNTNIKVALADELQMKKPMVRLV